MKYRIFYNFKRFYDLSFKTIILILNRIPSHLSLNAFIYFTYGINLYDMFTKSVKNFFKVYVSLSNPEILYTRQIDKIFKYFFYSAFVGTSTVITTKLWNKKMTFKNHLFGNNIKYKFCYNVVFLIDCFLFITVQEKQIYLDTLCI